MLLSARRPTFTSGNLGRRHQRLLRRQANQLYAVAHCARTDAKDPGPLSKGQGGALQRDAMGTTRVVRLFNPPNPSHIAWRIAAMVVHAFQAVFSSRSRPHGTEECGEALAPRRANRDATATIVAVRRVPAVQAPGLHVSPGRPFRGLGHAVLGNDLAVSASAGLSPSRTQIRLPREDDRPARATTPPREPVVLARTGAEQEQTAERVAGLERYYPACHEQHYRANV